MNESKATPPSTPQVTRRQALAGASLAIGAATLGAAEATADEPGPTASVKDFGFCLNTSTLRGQNLSLVELIELAASVGYDAIEPWIDDLEKHERAGHTLADAAKRIQDHGLRVASAIGFAEWIVDDEARRAKGLEEARRTMDMVARLGGKHIAAPPAGATDVAGLDLARAAERYRALCEIGVELGVRPQVEVWGFSKSLSRLGETLFVAVESGHPDACVLLDVYHLHKGGSGFSGVEMVSGSAMRVFHVNDYPAQPERAKLTDADRVYPGDGVAPLANLLGKMHANGFRGMLSLELFNRDYWKQDAREVARIGLEKTREVARLALAKG